MLLSKSFFARPTLVVAEELIGAQFIVNHPAGRLSGRIVETEAYHQDNDPASHSYRGRTARNAVMFGQPGCLYVYFTYGMHFCMNVVTEPEGIGAAVLIRAVEPIEGIELMQANRGKNIAFLQLTNGPAKCCKAFGIDRRHNGLALDGTYFGMDKKNGVRSESILRSQRIGIREGGDLLWRFYESGNPWVSRHTHAPNTKTLPT
jgi:DNA-3-methyladenine glycosylase